MPSLINGTSRRNLAIFSIAGAAIAITFAMFALQSTPDRQGVKPAASLVDDVQLSENEITKTFLIGYELALQPETSHKIKVNDFRWAPGIVEVGEVLVSTDEGKKFLEFSGDNFDYAITSSDGTTKYYDIDMYQIDVVPNTPYVKAYWIGEVPQGKEFGRISLSDYPSLRDAVELSSSWVPLENANDAATINDLIRDSNNKTFDVVLDDGTTEAYELRLLQSSQESVN